MGEIPPLDRQLGYLWSSELQAFARNFEFFDGTAGGRLPASVAELPAVVAGLLVVPGIGTGTAGRPAAAGTSGAMEAGSKLPKLLPFLLNKIFAIISLSILLLLPAST